MSAEGSLPRRGSASLSMCGMRGDTAGLSLPGVETGGYL